MTTRRRLVQMMVIVTALTVGGWLVISASNPGHTASAPIDAGAIATTEVKTQTDAGTDLDHALFREGVHFMGGTKSALGGVSGGAAMGDAEGLGGIGALMAGAKAPALLDQVPASDSVLSIHLRTTVGCRWLRSDPVNHREVTIATFPTQDCEWMETSFSPNGRWATVLQQDVGLWKVNLLNGEMTTLPAPPANDKLLQVGLDSAGNVYALTAAGDAELEEMEYVPHVGIRLKGTVYRMPKDFDYGGEETVAHAYRLADGKWELIETKFATTGARSASNAKVLAANRLLGKHRLGPGTDELDTRAWARVRDARVLKELNAISAASPKFETWELVSRRPRVYAKIDWFTSSIDSIVTPHEGVLTPIARDPGPATIKGRYALLVDRAEGEKLALYDLRSGTRVAWFEHFWVEFWP